jgi:uncharacterized membrane protein
MHTNRFARAWRHLWTTGALARRRFPVATLSAIEARVAQGETLHAAEVRVVIEPAFDLAMLRAGLDPRERARQVFGEQRVWDTEGNNGVLLYVLLADRRVEIVADRAAARLVPDREWQRVCEALAAHYARGEYLHGTLHAVDAMHRLLAPWFPPGRTNPDELPNRPVVL